MATAMKKFWFAVPIVLIGIFGILRGSGIATAAYNLIENGGSALTMRPTLNFVNSGCADNPTDNRTDCTISGGGSAYATIQNNGTPLTQRSILNFTTNITCMDDSGNMSTDCAASGGGAGAALACRFIRQIALFCWARSIFRLEEGPRSQVLSLPSK